MNTSPPTAMKTSSSAPGAKPSGVPASKWWVRHVMDGNPPQLRAVIRWPRVFLAAGCLVVGGYLSLATALWGYYSFYRKIPAVSWVDVAVLPRFPRVQAAIGAHYHAQAKALWEKRDFVQAILTARAAVLKAPGNLDARLFLAQCWQLAGRQDEAVRTLTDGIAFNATDARLHKAIVEMCLTTGRHAELLQIFRETLPARGVRLLAGGDRSYQLAEVRAVLETSGAAGADAAIAAHPGLAEQVVAAPLLARIDWEMGRREKALERLSEARTKDTKDIGVHDAYVEMAMRLGRSVDAREAAATFLKAHPNLPMAQLRFLEAHGSRQGADRALWMNECLRYLAQYREVPGALERLASLAAPQGWSDLNHMLYQNALQENLSGFPFAIYYAASLVKAADFARADAVWRELSVRNTAQLAPGTYVSAMIAWGLGNRSEATQLLERLHRETVGEPRKRQNLARIFRDFGQETLAETFERLQ